MNSLFSEIQIVRFSTQYQADIDEFMAAIESEFEEPISNPSPNAKSMTKMAMDSENQYWVALADGKAVGALGLTLLENDAVVLTSVFLASKFRRIGVAKSLLNSALNWAHEHSVRRVYLGTMPQFKAALRFYEKNGFEVIEKALLPSDFPLNPIDSVFCKLRMSTWEQASGTGWKAIPTGFRLENSETTVTDSEFSDLLFRVYVGGGFTSPQRAREIFVPTDVRARGHLIGARALVDDQFVGMVIVVLPDSPARRIAQIDETELHLLAVDGAFRGCGLGRELVKSATDFVNDSGFRKIVLWTQTTMTSAQRLYESEGFSRAVDRDPFFEGKKFLAYEKKW